MFCPKCGNQLPDDASFCGHCGNKIENRPTIPKPSNSVVSTKAAGATQSVAGLQLSQFGVSGTQVLSVVFAIIAVIFGLMPWFITSDTLIYAGKAGSAISSALTFNTYSTANFDESYTFFGLGDFSSDLATYLSGTKRDSISAMDIAQILFALGLIMLVVGSILLILKRIKVVLIIGALLAIGVAIYFGLFFYPDFVAHDWAESSINPIVCAISSLVALILAAVTKNGKNVEVSK